MLEPFEFQQVGGRPGGFLEAVAWAFVGVCSWLKNCMAA